MALEVHNMVDFDGALPEQRGWGHLHEAMIIFLS